MSKISEVIEEKVMPAVVKIGQNRVLGALTAGMMSIMPLTLGTFLIAIAANLPIPGWSEWLVSSGVKGHMNAVLGATLELIGIYVAFTIAFHYAKSKESDGMTAGVLSLGSFLILMPQQVQTADGGFVDAFLKTYLGSSGIFVAMITAILVASLFSFLDKKGLTIKLPDSVPEMVSKSLSPTFVAIIIFCIVFFVRVGFGATSYENIFNFINTVVAKPILSLGGSSLALVGLFTLVNLFWWFGIHPSTLMNAYMPVIMSTAIANTTAFLGGESLPHLDFSVLFSFGMVGGTGLTLGLVTSMVLFAKSERFKALSKIAIIPSLFNINEPLVFGTPIIYNPIFLIPMVLSPSVAALVAKLFINLGAFNSFNPTVALPWATPAPITAFLQTGIMAAIAIIISVIATGLLYFPFFKVADKKALKEEQEVTQ